MFAKKTFIVFDTMQFSVASTRAKEIFEIDTTVPITANLCAKGSVCTVVELMVVLLRCNM